MTHEEIKNRLTEVFREVFDDDSLTISEETTARDVPDWDSIMHITLVVAVEQHFRVRFTTREVSDLPNVGALMALIGRKAV